MARTFNGSTDKLLSSTCPITNYPLTFACWCLPENTGTNKGMISIGNNDNENFATIYLPSSEIAFMYFRLQSATDRIVQATSTASFTNWNHYVGTIDSSRVPRIYFNGTLEGTGTDGGAGNFGTLSAVGVGVREQSPDDQFFQGALAEAAIWNRQLGQTEITALAKGFAPTWFGNGLVFYRDLIRDLNRPYIGPALTETGTTVSGHPKNIVYPYRRVFSSGILLPALHLEIDEAVADDADRISSSAGPVLDMCEIAIEPFDLPSAFNILEVEYHFSRGGVRTIDLTVKLMSGETEIASWTHLDIPDTVQRASQVLTQSHINQISDPPDLRLRFIANTA